MSNKYKQNQLQNSRIGVRSDSRISRNNALGVTIGSSGIHSKIIV